MPIKTWMRPPRSLRENRAQCIRKFRSKNGRDHHCRVERVLQLGTWLGVGLDETGHDCRVSQGMDGGFREELPALSYHASRRAPFRTDCRSSYAAAQHAIHAAPGNAEALRDRSGPQRGPQLPDLRRVDADGAALVLAGGLRLGDTLALPLRAAALEAKLALVTR
jgi:hypothetical protein